MSQALYIVWSDKYDTGIPLIDEQHRGLVSLVNTFFFHKADADKNVDRYLTPTAETLKSYTQLHFYTLERLMQESGFPRIKEEIENHQEMMATITRNEIKYKAARDADGFLDFLKQYWQEHACRRESDFIDHIKKYLGVK